MVSKRWTWPAALAVLFAGLTNAHAHVHYCFDGQEPPAAVHLVDGMSEAGGAPCHDANDCDYVDVDVPNQAFGKACGDDHAAIAPGLTFTTPAPAVGGARADHRDLSPTPNPRYAHPQMRAPPR